MQSVRGCASPQTTTHEPYLAVLAHGLDTKFALEHTHESVDVPCPEIATDPQIRNRGIHHEVASVVAVEFSGRFRKGRSVEGDHALLPCEFALDVRSTDGTHRDSRLGGDCGLASVNHRGCFHARRRSPPRGIERCNGNLAID